MSNQIQTSKTQKVSSLKQVLAASIINLDMDDLFSEHEYSSQMKMTLASISSQVSLVTVISSKKIFQTTGAIGEENTHKIICYIIFNFVESIKVKDEFKMQPHEIFEVSYDIMKKYTHDSIDDIILAFKLARQEGKVFYNSVSAMDIYQILNDYFEKRKPSFLEDQAEKHKEAEKSQDLVILSRIAEGNPELAEKLKEKLGPSTGKKAFTEDQIKERVKASPQSKKPLKKGVMNEKEFKQKYQQQTEES